jgi:hypothetical protein
VKDLQFCIGILKMKKLEYELAIELAKDFNNLKAHKLSIENSCDCRLNVAEYEKRVFDLEFAIEVLQKSDEFKNSIK